MSRLGRTYTRLVRRIRPVPAAPPVVERCPPTLVSSTSTAWNTATSPKTLSITWETGDVIVVGAMSSDDQIAEIGTLTATGLTFTQDENVETGSQSLLKVWTDVAASGGTANLTLSMTTNPNSAPWGFHAFVFRGSDGVGAEESTGAGGAPSRAITTTAANSAVLVFNADWAAVVGGSRVWRTVDGITPTSGNALERDYFNSANYTTYVAYYDDVAPAGAYTTGLSAPGGQTYSIAAIEVKGAICVEPPAAWAESWNVIQM